MRPKVLVPVQARGGKFLGPDIGSSGVVIRNAVSGRILAHGVASGGSGDTPTSSFTAGASRDTIVVQPATVNWLSPVTTPPTAGFLATLDLDRPTLVEIS